MKVILNYSKRFIILFSVFFICSTFFFFNYAFAYTSDYNELAALSPVIDNSMSSSSNNLVLTFANTDVKYNYVIFTYKSPDGKKINNYGYLTKAPIVLNGSYYQISGAYLTRQTLTMTDTNVTTIAAANIVDNGSLNFDSSKPPITGYTYLGCTWRNASNLGDQLYGHSVNIPADVDIDSLYFKAPVNNAYLSGAFYKQLQNIKYTIYGKSKFNSDFSVVTGFNTVVKDDIRSRIYNSLKFKSNVGEYKSAMPMVDFYGDIDDWKSQGYYCFKITGTMQVPTDFLKLCGGKLTVTVSADTMQYYNQGFGFDKWHNIKSSPVTWNVKYYVDSNGDGKDDSTGSTMPDGAIVDNDNDGIADGVVEGGDGTSSTSSSSSDTSGGFFNTMTNVINDITNFLKSCTDMISGLASTISTFTASIWGIFNFLPDPLPTLIRSAIGIMIFVAIIKFIRG